MVWMGRLANKISLAAWIGLLALGSLMGEQAFPASGGVSLQDFVGRHLIRCGDFCAKRCARWCTLQLDVGMEDLQKRSHVKRKVGDAIVNLQVAVP